MDVFEFRAQLVATDGEQLKMLGIYDNFPILVGARAETLSELLLARRGFSPSVRKPHINFVNDAGLASLIQVRNEKINGYVSMFMLHSDYDQIGIPDPPPYEWLRPLRDATLAIIDTVVEHRIPTRFMHHYHPKARPHVDYVPEPQPH